MEKVCKTCGTDKNLTKHNRYYFCNSCANKGMLPALGILIVVITLFIFLTNGSSEKDTSVWRNSTRTIQTVERDNNGNVVGVNEEVINGQENQDGFFSPEWYPDN